jgi:hypothetical protein
LCSDSLTGKMILFRGLGDAIRINKRLTRLVLSGAHFCNLHLLCGLELT